MDHSFNKKNIITFDPTPRKSGGGSEKSLLETLKGLKNLGNEIQIGIINPKDYEILDIYKQNGFKIKNIFAVYLKNKSNPFDYIKLYRSQKKFDLKGNDIIYVNGYYDLPLAVILKLINKIPIVCHLRIPPNLSKQYLYSLKFVDKFVAATPKLRDLYIKHASIPNEKFVIIPNGFNFPEKWQPKKHHKIGEQFRIIYIGRISIEKGIMELYEVFKEIIKTIPNSTLTITGPTINKIDEVFKEKLLENIRNENLQDIVSINTPVSDPIKYLSNFDLCIFPSLLEEAFGRILCESIIAGIPIISNNIGSADFILNDYNHIWIYKNKEELYQKILKYYYYPYSYPINEIFDYMKKNFSFEKYLNYLNRLLNEQLGH